MGARKLFSGIFLFLFILSGSSFAQLLSWSPLFPDENSTSFSITMDASYGNRGLFNYSTATDVYVHTGVITNLSATSTDWKYVKFNQNFNTPNAQLQATYLGSNKWRFTFSGSIRSYYGVPAGETIQKIAILFRSGNGSLAQRNADGSDMYIPVFGNSLSAYLFQPFKQPTFVARPEPVNLNVGDSFPVSGGSNVSSDLSIFYNGTLLNTASAAVSITAQPQPVITAAGPQQVVLKATSGAVTRYDTIQFFVAGPPAISPLPAGVREGINYDADPTVATLVLFAPGKQRVCVIGDMPGSNWQEQWAYQMNKTPDGNYWWLKITGLLPGIEYSFQYLVNGNLAIADPYAENVLDPWNDPFITAATYPSLKPYPTGLTTGVVSLFQTAAPVYSWGSNAYVRPDKRSLVIYELLLRDFIAAHDWKTLRDTLHYFKNLGINAIEIMPLNEFEGNSSWGYNPDFYFAPDKYYGPANDLKRFIDSCHSNGIAVIMDIALNHSFGLSPLVQLYWDSSNNRPAANNPWYNPVAKHAFNIGYDFNHESPSTKKLVSRVLEHWLLKYKVDGFRFDLSKGFTQTQTCDNNGANCDVGAWGGFDQSRIDILSRYYDSMQLYAPGSVAILEHFADNSEELVLSNKGFLLWGNMNYNYTQASMGFSSGCDISYGLHVNRNWTLPHLVTYMESHDEERISYKNINFGNAASGYSIKDSLTSLQRMELSEVFLLAAPGPKMIWQFGEWGYDYPINYCANGTVNNNCRTDPKPIKWNYYQEPGRRAIFMVAAQLNRLRQDAFFQPLFYSNDIAYNLNGLVKWMKVSAGNASMVVLGNFDVTGKSVIFSFPSTGTWYNYLNPPDSVVITNVNQNYFFKPGEYRVYINRFLPLPGTVTSFTGVNNGFQNQLDWATINESSVSGYELERSIDSINFSQIAFVACNNSGDYSYGDDIAPLSSNVFFYRLKIMEKGGGYRFSKIIRIARPTVSTVSYVYPNPFRDFLAVHIANAAAGTAVVSVYDATGRLLLKKSVIVAAGDNEIELNEAAKWPAGVYVLRYINRNNNFVFRLIKR